jgi:hypothetical protein
MILEKAKVAISTEKGSEAQKALPHKLVRGPTYTL